MFSVPFCFAVDDGLGALGKAQAPVQLRSLRSLRSPFDGVSAGRFERPRETLRQTPRKSRRNKD